MNKTVDSDSFYDVFVAQNGDELECLGKSKKWCSSCDRELCWAKSKCQITHLDCHSLCAGGCSEPDNPDACFVCKGVLTKDGKCVEECPPET